MEKGTANLLGSAHKAPVIQRNDTFETNSEMADLEKELNGTIVDGHCLGDVNERLTTATTTLEAAPSVFNDNGSRLATSGQSNDIFSGNLLSAKDDLAAACHDQFESIANSKGPPLPAHITPPKPSSSKAVTAERKQQLLLEAREARISWLGRVPLPYKANRNGLDLDDSLEILGQTYALSKLPSAARLLQDLYHLNSVNDSFLIKAHIQRLISGEQSEALYPTGQEIIEDALSQSDGDDYLSDYAKFWKAMHEPSCSMLVQSIRKSLSQLQLDKDNAASKLFSVVDSFYSQLQQHPLLKEHRLLRRCLESFVFGQCYPHILEIFSTQASRQAEVEFQARLGKLQFMTLKHLDASIDSMETDQPIATLQSISNFFSVYDKLQCILALYQSVNEALRKAMSCHTGGKAPSADDILPAIIYVVIQARPIDLLFNIRLLEDLAPQEYLRGEAGYAFTNLYGAVQFLLDLDLESGSNVNMSPSEWRQGMENSVAAMQERRVAQVKCNDGVLDEVSWPVVQLIPPMEIRNAKERGVNIDLEWALQWHIGQGGRGTTPLASTAFSEDATVFLHRAESTTSRPDSILPPGFSRSYNYLTTRPEDLRLGDLTPLLSEYRLLVQTTEALLAERRHLQREQNKADAFCARKEAYKRSYEVDLSNGEAYDERS